jgi:hypothetical protein
MRLQFIAYAMCLCLPGLVSGQSAKAKVLPKAAKQADKQAPQSIPGKQIERLQKMTPEEREKALANLPPERRQQVEKQLNRLDQLTPQQRQQLDERFERLQSFPPARQRAVRQEVQSLRALRFSERQARLHSEEFKQQFSAEEQDLIRGVFPGAAR